jgi:primosomal protein N' (replication factor Y)
MPKITIVDMKQEKMPKTQFISTSLKTKMMEMINAGGQAMFFLNRRGYAPIVLCSCCGERIKCKFCDVHLTEHRVEGKLKCHHCGYVREKPKICEACAGEDTMKVMGAGVERIQEELCQILPKNQVVLLTSDTLSSPIKTREVITKIESGEAKVIVGTQVVSKGYHFPNLRFVGVLDADFGLNIEDFRAFEKTFQLLYQVAGRTGRERADGEVYIQTFDPKNKVLFSIVNYDKIGFYNLEIEARKKFKLPPFSKQVAFVVAGDEKLETLDFAKKFSVALEEEFKGLEGFSLFGPSVPIISFLRNRYRFRILILSTRYFNLQERILKVLDGLKLPKSITIKTDVDPISFY